MTTDFQTARVGLGARLRELRTEAGLSGKDLAAHAGWQRSKVSRIETGKQTPSPTDLEAWAEVVGRPEITGELKGRLQGLETRYRSWRRQLGGGHRARQEFGATEVARTRILRGLEVVCVPGLFQTPDYARHMLTASSAFHRTPRDTEAAVRARMKGQEVLYEPGRHFRFLLWEGALHTRVCPTEVMVRQLERLIGLIGLDTVELGIIPLGVRLRRMPSHNFWIYDSRLVVVETINTELWLDDDENIALYGRAWDWLSESAVTGHRAHRLIARARASLGPA